MFIAAFAKSGPLLRLQEHMTAWRKAGKTSAAILGVDHQGTSKEALELANSLFDQVYVTQDRRITFHPKIYLFTGENSAEAFVGSNNLTVGGTETNFEAAVQVKLELPVDAQLLGQFETAWCNLLPECCEATDPLDSVLLARLVADRVVINEKDMRKIGGRSNKSRVGRSQRSSLYIKPASPLPAKVAMQVHDVSDSQGQFGMASATSAASSGSDVELPPAHPRGHVIQIKPHHNGEIFLSVTAVLQYPHFFRWPFHGETTPKNPGNPTYPQLEPDPIVNIEVFGEDPNPILRLPNYPLNTVYYERKSEIRITASPLVDVTPEYSIMIMELSDAPDISYEIAIHRPESTEYEDWLAICNQQMPGGGRRPRRFGWF